VRILILSGAPDYHGCTIITPFTTRIRRAVRLFRDAAYQPLQGGLEAAVEDLKGRKQ
jgi:hypothetical protein